MTFRLILITKSYTEIMVFSLIDWNGIGIRERNRVKFTLTVTTYRLLL